jgi:hypothetical protein
MGGWPPRECSRGLPWHAPAVAAEWPLFVLSHVNIRRLPQPLSDADVSARADPDQLELPLVRRGTVSWWFRLCGTCSNVRRGGKGSSSHRRSTRFRVAAPSPVPCLILQANQAPPRRLGGDGVDDHSSLRDRLSSPPDRRALAMRQEGSAPPSHQDTKKDPDSAAHLTRIRHLGVLVTWWFKGPLRRLFRA